MKKPELLMPAGDPATLKTALRFGADAVYIGGEAFSLRAKADNFNRENMEQAVAFCHEKGKKLYVAVNIYAHNRDLPEVERYLKELKEIGPDALIVSDPGIFSLCRNILPEVALHISTQMNTTNYEAFRFWHALGASRVVCARELSLEEIGLIREKIPEDMEIEAFVHGAMCISYSGRCLLSAYMTGRSANEGACTHPCRWNYRLVEETRPGEYYPVEENDRGTYIFNSKDLCMIGSLSQMLEAGIGSLKVEGRMKTELYVATVAGVYRKAIDDFFEDPSVYRKNIPLYEEEISKCTYRDYTTGFYFGKPGPDAQIYSESTYIRNYRYLGTVSETDEKGRALITQKNKFSVGDCIEVLKPGLISPQARVLSLTDAVTGEPLTACPHPGQKLWVALDTPAECGDLLRVRNSP